MKKLNAIFDTDGVTLNWYYAMCIKFNKPYDMCDKWDIPWLHAKFAEIKDDMEFWESLPILSHVNSLPNNINLIHHLTACPHRAPRIINLQNTGWLDITNCPTNHKVTVSDKKVNWLQKHVGYWDVFVDDKPSTINEVRSHFDGMGKHIIRFVPEYVDYGHQQMLDEAYKEQTWASGFDTLASIKHLSQLKQLGYANNK